MTTFQIDTGDLDRPQHGRIDYCQALQDAAFDSLPEDAPQEDIDAALAKLIVADLVAPKTAKTVRTHFARYWPLIWSMAATSPPSFDFIIEQFAERLAELR
jgi:hypothetical protein